MWNSCQKKKRLKKAIEYRNLNPASLNLDEVGKLLIKRGISDHKLNAIMWDLLSVIEPPSCGMTHCKNYGNQHSFCNCSLERVPGRCPINKAYLKRKKEKEDGNITV